MSKLPNAPLLEVIFEIRWDISSKSDIVDFQYLHGDLYANLKDKYPLRENLVPPDVPHDIVRGVPVFRFRASDNSYPLLQIGPGLISFNTNDSKYFWEDFSKEANNILVILNDIYPRFKELHMSPALTYLDFFDYDKEKMTSLEFVNSNLQLNISESFLETKIAKVDDIDFTLNYKVNNDLLSLNLRDGKTNNGKNGIVLQTKLIGNKSLYKKDELIIWLNTAHELCSNIFKSLTKGDLYKSFN